MGKTVSGKKEVEIPKEMSLETNVEPSSSGGENSEAYTHRYAEEPASQEKSHHKPGRGDGKRMEGPANLTMNMMDLDTLDIIPYIDAYVKVKLVTKYTYVGFVHSIDPHSHCVILSVPKEEGRYQTVFIPGTSVLNITKTTHDASITPPKYKEIGGILSPEVQHRKKQIISWLKDNRISVAEKDGNILFASIMLLPPYGDKDICTNNQALALEVKNILDRMPANYEPK